MSKYNKNELEFLLLTEKLSYSEIGRKYNVSGNAISKAAKRLGITVPYKRNINPNENFNKGCKKSLVYKITDIEFINIIIKSKGWYEIFNNLGYKTTGSTTRNLILDRCNELNITPNIEKQIPVSTITKGFLFTNRKNWQSARSHIQKDARRVFFNNNPNPKCSICGYSNHVEVAHIKPVSEFSNETLVSEINSPINLIGLCPNHHWEFDNGIVNIDDFLK